MPNTRQVEFLVIQAELSSMPNETTTAQTAVGNPIPQHGDHKFNNASQAQTHRRQLLFCWQRAESLLFESRTGAVQMALATTEELTVSLGPQRGLLALPMPATNLGDSTNRLR